METIISYLQRQVKSDYKKLVNVVWNDKRVQKKIISLNIYGQLFDKGIDSEGKSIGEYSPVSVEKFGKREGHIQLRDTGEFYESFEILVNGVEAEILADTQKEDTDLAVEYGTAIIGLTDESKEVLSKIIRVVVKEQVEKRLRVN